jgi:hypothetical protein
VAIDGAGAPIIRAVAEVTIIIMKIAFIVFIVNLIGDVCLESPVFMVNATPGSNDLLVRFSRDKRQTIFGVF